MVLVEIANRISTAVVFKNDATNTRIAYLEKDGRIVGKSYDTSVGAGEKKSFGSIDEARAWVHEIAPKNAEFKDNRFYSKDHYDNIGKNRRDFEEMWKIHNEPKDMVRLLNGSETYFDRVVGYCAHHKTYLTKQQLQTKQCLGKECNRLIKVECNFWKERDQKQVEKRLKKAMEVC